jgi:hypothetical protein
VLGLGATLLVAFGFESLSQYRRSGPRRRSGFDRSDDVASAAVPRSRPRTTADAFKDRVTGERDEGTRTDPDDEVGPTGSAQDRYLSVTVDARHPAERPILTRRQSPAPNGIE